MDLSGAQLGVIQEEHQRHAQAGDMQPELRRRKGRPSSSSKQDRGHERRACRCRGRGAIGAERPAGDRAEQDDHAREAARPARVRASVKVVVVRDSIFTSYSSNVQDVALCCYCCMNKVTSRWCTNKSELLIFFNNIDWSTYI